MNDYGHYEPHPFAGIFDLIRGREFDELVASIKENGIREAIVIFEGKVLDGRNRLRAAIAAGISSHDVPARVFADGDPMAFVWDANVTRRHLDTAQLALAAAERANLEWGERRTEAAATASVTQREAADSLGIHRASVQRAKVVLDKGSEDLKDLMRAGNISLKSGEQIARMAPEKQEQVIARAKERTKGDDEKLPRALFVEAFAEAKRAKHTEIAAGNRLADHDGSTYDVFLADPPWRFADATNLKAAEDHYPTMPIREMCQWEPYRGVKVKDIAAPKAVLFLWTPTYDSFRLGLAYGKSDPLAGNARDVAEAWGFSHFHQCFVWVKPKPSPGWFAHNQYEFLFVYSRGGWPAPPIEAIVSNVLQGPDWPQGAHSVKPRSTHTLIERMTPGDYRRIEFFARESVPGWTVIGNQAPTE